MGIRKIGVAISVVAIVAASFTTLARADEYNDEIFDENHVSGGAMILDAVVARPLLLVATGVGSAMFVVSAPFAAAGGNIGTVWGTLVATPGEQLLARCLGCTPVQYKRIKSDRDTEIANSRRP